jgi:lipopolysaccharide transport system permease protein
MGFDRQAPAVTPAPWDMIIRAKRNWFDLRLLELWKARDLIMLFVWRDFVAGYKQTILGPLWYLLQPLLTTLTFTVIFGRMAKFSTDGLPPFLFYMAGTVIWTYFANCLNKTSTTFVFNANLFGKVYFPRLAAPVSILISNLATLAIQFGLFLAFAGYFALKGAAIRPNVSMLLTPLLVFVMAGLGLGLGIIVSSLTTKYRDLSFLVSFGVQLLMYVTPVVYPASAVPERYRALALANPMAPIVETFRYAFLGAGTVSWVHLLYSFGIMVVVLVAGILIFNRVEQTFMDTV